MIASEDDQHKSEWKAVPFEAMFSRKPSQSSLKPMRIKSQLNEDSKVHRQTELYSSEEEMKHVNFPPNLNHNNHSLLGAHMPNKKS